MEKDSSWRPEGWINKNKGLDYRLYSSGEQLCAEREFEAGTDAMLEALFKLARESPTGTFVIDSKIEYCYHLGRLKGGK